MHEPRSGKTRDSGQSPERKVLFAEAFANVLENPANSRMNPYCSTAIQKVSSNPAFYSLWSELRAKCESPAYNLCRGDAVNFTLNSLYETGAQFALRVKKSYE